MSQGNPIVSIITPTYNRAAFLSIAVNSVLAQTFSNFELIVIDDGSTDATRTVIDGFLDDSRVKYFYQDNQGQSIARNRGIEVAKGEFVCFLDSDNAWVSTKLERSLKAFEEDPDSDIVYGDYIVIDEGGTELGVNHMKRYSGRVTPQLLHDNFVSMNTTMTRMRCFLTMGGFDENDRLAEDYGLWLRFSTRYKFCYLPEILGYYRVMKNQISTDKARRFEANERLILQFLADFPHAVSSMEKLRGLSGFYVRRSRFEFSTGQTARSLTDLLRAFFSYPLWIGPWRALAKISLCLFQRRNS